MNWRWIVAFPPENWPTDFHPLPSVDPVIGNLAWVDKYKPLLGVVPKHIAHGWRVWEGAWAICHRTSDRRYTARELENTFARNLDVEVTLVNRGNFFLFTPMLHEVAASDLNLIAIVNPIRRMLKRASFFEGENDK